MSAVAPRNDKTMPILIVWLAGFALALCIDTVVSR